jgi:hypothetical protein
MAKDSDHLAGTFGTENTGGILSGLLAEENEFDHASMWRIGSWGVAAVAAVVVAVMANQTSLGWRRDQMAAADLSRQAQQLQALTKESQNETRRLAAAVDTLNSDSDRLYSRVTVLEQGLDSVTGALTRQNSAAAQPPPPAGNPTGTTDAQPPAQNQAAAPALAPVTTTTAPATAAPKPTTTLAKTDAAPKPDPAAKSEKPRTEAAAKEQKPLLASPAAASASSTAPTMTPSATATPPVAEKSMLAPPDPAAQKPTELEKPVVAKAEEAPRPLPDITASVEAKEPDASHAASPRAAVQRTEFAIDVGSANSIGGLRALWRGLIKSNSELAALRPIIMVKESATGLGMQLRLAAGPLSDAAAAAKICAALIESERSCETTVFDGQRLAMKADEQPPSVKPSPPQPQPHRRGYYPKRSTRDDPPPRPESSTLSRLFGRDSPKP